ncbi:4-hydroxy-tetrahydrodipicolinate reductase [Aquabacterium sp. NJ1]|uniref:4-hydroxy-tetrahydrodipicolinate reductase n=1 Tax=Aquabacterium sp. NJ1 TaxID=1538295 RepID=UPI00052DDF8F|nr:4-hydroxy-tetrahydrodipicolinate reductase [Aquabacterium sp. NJ1]KGM40800.1 4-hydroxy-tetrahydrodipicolinate reductase [Aquabacterium sp. NJ1]
MSTAANASPVHQIAIAGASGRMGRMLIEAVHNAADAQLAGALDIAASPAIGADASAFLGANSGVTITSDLRAGLKNARYLIDFTRPEGTMEHLRVCRELGVKMIIGTTGFTDAQKAEIEDAARDIGIMMSPNMAVGVNVVFKLLEQAARALKEGYDIEIIEAHHRHKVDAPSGTALKMGEIVAEGVGRNLQECAIYGREGVTGERAPSTIGFATVRGGDIVGDHTVLFAGIGERIEITHKSSSRATYAQGSLRAVRFLANQPHGLFGMDDVLGLK